MRVTPIAASAMALAIATATAVAIATGPAASARNAPSKDAFTGTVVSASGRLAPDRARLEIDLVAPSLGRQARRLTLTFHGRRCAGKPHCVTLTGRVTGMLNFAARRLPDTGRGFTIRASGTVTPLGHVSARGTVQGTGFIATGRITMDLTLSTKTGKMTINAQSGLVPGFTSP